MDPLGEAVPVWEQEFINFWQEFTVDICDGRKCITKNWSALACKHSLVEGLSEGHAGFKHCSKNISRFCCAENLPAATWGRAQPLPVLLREIIPPNELKCCTNCSANMDKSTLGELLALSTSDHEHLVFPRPLLALGIDFGAFFSYF